MHEASEKQNLLNLELVGLWRISNRCLIKTSFTSNKRPRRMNAVASDMLRVQLGLKPAAAYLLPVFKHYTLPDGRLPNSYTKNHMLMVCAYDFKYGAMWRQI